ncbi:DUF268 domain-containing protein [Patescibacteria group bacterium]
MKKILLFPIKLLIKLLQLIQSLINRVIFYLSILRTYLAQNECEKFKDCVLLNKLKKNQPPASDRYIEYPWMLENIDITEGKLLDIGSTICEKLSCSLAESIEINCLNLNDVRFKNPDIKFIKGDIRKTDFPENHFDCITCISTLEHIGVAGRYHSDNDPEGDLKAMTEIKKILKSDGTLLITVPYGIKDILPINKLYNSERIERLFEGFEIEKIQFRKFSPIWGVWLKVNEQEASKTDMLKDRWYAICLIKAKNI